MEKSVDFIGSNATLEHIPKCDIEKIMTECHRILKVGGIMTLSIDYSDHYSHTDKKISAYNYLRFTDAQWKKYNFPMRFQNRMRNCDYENIFRQSGFSILESNPYKFTSEDKAAISKIEIADCFKNYSEKDLLIKNNSFVLQKVAR